MAESALLKHFEITVDLKRPVAIRPFEVVEGDTGNRIGVTLTDDGVETPLDGYRIVAVFSNSRGISVQDSEDGSMTISGSRAEIRLMPASFAPGMVECELQIYSAPSTRDLISRTELVTTAKFNFSCRRAILNGESIHSMPQMPMLEELISDVESAEEARQTAEAARQTAEAARQAAEQTRQANESARISAESARASAETVRLRAEQARDSAEEARALAESARQTAEAARQAAEAARQAAEQSREAAMSSFLSQAGLTVISGSEAPTSSTEGEAGRIRYASADESLYFSLGGSAGAGYRWKRVDPEPDWVTIKEFGIRTNSNLITVDTDSTGDPFRYDELRFTFVGIMTGGSGMYIYLNGDDSKFINDGPFMNTESASVTVSNLEKNRTVLTLKKAKDGFITSVRYYGGVTNNQGNSQSRTLYIGTLPVTDWQGYTSVKFQTSNTGHLIKAGTTVKVEGRNF
ncbi:MAG: hypothetical protein IJM18_03735 [Clostridia bacterium]|nr:hypothetical protein [Clostridia bacterium]